MAKGKVTRVPDGDTIKVKEGPYIRLAGVDAPEKRQKGFGEAKEDLKNLVMGKTVTYTEEAIDRYGRVVAKVKVGDKNINKIMERKLNK